jgi:hypothetical protein
MGEDKLARLGFEEFGRTALERSLDGDALFMHTFHIRRP